MPPPIRPVARAALAYFGGIFALGFVLGTLRTLSLAPRLGAVGAVALELPIMLGASWLLARRLTRPRVFARPSARAAMGGIAFVLLLGAELALALTLFGQSAGQWLAALARPAGALGLAGQAAFGLIPLALGRRAGRG